MKRIISFLVAGAVLIGIFISGSSYGYAEINTDWETSMAQSIAAFEDLGGYCTSKKVQPGFTQTTWQGLDEAVNLTNSDRPIIDVTKARPSFCSAAVYMAFLKALDNYSLTGKVKINSKSWEYLKPYTIEDRKYPVQDDGVGAWGMANANGPGFAALAYQIGIGTNYYIGLLSEYKNLNERELAFNKAHKFDIMKIFWNDYVGKDERGHLVIYLGKTDNVKNQNGASDNYIYYWSSNGSKTDINAGYGIKKCKESAIKRAVITHISQPNNINNVEKILPTNKNQFLADIGSIKNATSEEIKQICGISDDTDDTTSTDTTSTDTTSTDTTSTDTASTDTASTDTASTDTTSTDTTSTDTVSGFSTVDSANISSKKQNGNVSQVKEVTDSSELEQSIFPKLGSKKSSIFICFGILLICVFFAAYHNKRR